MPYLDFLRCENCGEQAPLSLDYMATISAYNADGRKESFVNPATLVWDYLIYGCELCGRKYKYTYRDVERRVREYFSSLSHKYKDYFDELVKYQDSEESRRDGSFFAKQEPTVRKRIDKLYQHKGQ